MRSVIATLAFLIASSPVAAAQTRNFPPQPEGVAWPTEGWETARLSPDVNRVVLQDLLDSAFERSKTEVMGETRAVIIVYRGKVVYERYRQGFGPDTLQVSWSMAKSVTHGLVGRAVALGRIEDVNAPMPGPWPTDDPRAGITWLEWLAMTDGLDYSEIGAEGLADNDVVQMMYGPGRYDVVEYAAGLKSVAEPGTRWNYSTAGFHLLASALQSALGLDCQRGEDFEPTDLEACRNRAAPFVEWADRALFDRIGMQATIEFDDTGTFLGGSLVWASARDFAKFGYLYLRGGVWNGERLLPEGWASMARTRSADRSVNTYGSGFWLAPPAGEVANPQGPDPELGPADAFSAQGHEGQVIWIVPSRDLVIVRLGLMPNSEQNWQVLYDWCQSIAMTFPESSATQTAPARP